MKILLYGNAGSGKSVMAQKLSSASGATILSLDEIAWNPGPERKPMEETIQHLDAFLNQHDNWIIEGCYGELIETLLPYCEELRFLNPGIEACVANCLNRPWEPDKFASKEEQDAMLKELINWVREYEKRDDIYGLACHRRIFDSFEGKKREYTAISDY